MVPHGHGLYITKRQLINVVFTIICFIIFIFSMNSSLSASDSWIYALSLAGWFLWIYCIVSWKNATGEYFSLYAIFISFFIVFNYGQCLMWGLGVHSDKEIGVWPSFGVSISQYTILEGQLVTLMAIVAFHCGAMISYRRQIIDNNPREHTTHSVRQDNVLRTFSTFSLFVSTVCLIYENINNIIITKSFGYGANLYNAGVVSSQNNFIVLISWMFMPSIIAVLLTRDFSKKSMVICYSLLLLDAVMEMFAGDRGWIYWLFVLIWMHHKYYKPIRIRSAVLLFVGVIVVMFLSVAVSQVRLGSISLDTIMETVTTQENPIAAAFFELGNSMKPALIILQDSNISYPFGNTYILALFGMVTERLIKLFIPTYIGVGGWFSQDYLKLSYGADFSIVAEALINFGVYGSLIALFVLGIVITRILLVEVDQTNKLNLYLKIATFTTIIPIVRGTMLSVLKHEVFSVLLIYIAVIVIANFFDRRQPNR